MSMHDKQSGKCDVCVESKITNKTCYPIKLQTKLLGLNHIDLSDLKQIVSRGDKNYFITFIDNYSRYIRVLNQT